MQLPQLQQQFQDTELGQQEQNSQLANSLASTQQLQNNQFQLQNLLWDQELEELLVAKSFPLGSLHDHLGKEKLEPVQLPQNLLENDEQKKLDKPEFAKKNFDKESFQPDSFDKIAEGAFRQQLSADGFTAASQTDSFSGTACHNRVSPKQLHYKSFPQLTLKESLGEQRFFRNSFQKHSLQTRTSTRPTLQ